MLAERAVDRAWPDAHRIVNRHSCRMRLAWGEFAAERMRELVGGDMGWIEPTGTDFLGATTRRRVFMVEHEPIESVHHPDADCAGDGSLQRIAQNIVTIVGLLFGRLDGSAGLV